MEHLMLDGYGGNQELMENTDIVLGLTKRVASLVGNLVEIPYVMPYFEGLVPEDCGISTTGIFEDGGHIAVHTFSRRRIVFVDVAREGEEIFGARKEIRRQVAETFMVGDMDEFDRGTEGLTILPSCFGPHFIVDGKLERPFGMEEIYNFIDELPYVVDMTPIAKPQVIKRGNGEMTGMVVIAESHIALHQKLDGRFSLDIFSCKPFDIDRLVVELSRKGIPLDQKTLIGRGLKFGR